MVKRLVFKIISKATKPGIVYFNHGLENEIKNPFIQHLHYKASDFENFILFWMNMGFEFISMTNLTEISAKRFKFSKPWIHLTFDDGYLNNKTVLLPILEKYNIPVTIFISTRHVRQQERFDTYKIKCALKYTKTTITTYELGFTDIKNRIVSAMDNDSIQLVINQYKYFNTSQKESFFDKINNLLTNDEWNHYNSLYTSDQTLTIDDLKELSKHPLIHIASHGENHYLFSTLSEQEMNNEFVASKSWLEEICKKEITAFCYPNGTIDDYNELSMKLCAESGYKLAFTTNQDIPRKKCNVMEIPRIFMIPQNPDKDIKFILKKSFKLLFN